MIYIGIYNVLFNELIFINYVLKINSILFLYVFMFFFFIDCDNLISFFIKITKYVNYRQEI